MLVVTDAYGQDTRSTCSYIADTLAELPDDAPYGSTALIGNKHDIYIKHETEWVLF